MTKMKLPYGLKANIQQQNGVYKANLEVTPHIASQWLKLNKGNRPKKKNEILAMARDIINGHWKYNGDPIRFDKKGHLIDGQNRLYAVVKADQSIIADVVVGLDSNVFETIDVGVKRSASDVAYLMGVTNHTVVGSAAKIVLNLQKNEWEREGEKTRVRTWEVKEFIDNNKKFDEVCNVAVEITRGCNPLLITKSFAAAYLWILSAYNWDEAVDFITKIISGTNVSRTDPEWKLRNLLLKGFHSPLHKMNTKALSALIIKTWNARIEGKEIGRLSFNKNEKFPKPIL